MNHCSASPMGVLKSFSLWMISVGAVTFSTYEIGDGAPRTPSRWKASPPEPETRTNHVEFSSSPRREVNATRSPSGETATSSTVTRS